MDNHNGEQLETPADSQSEITTADEGREVNPEGASQPSAEEVAFNSLKGSTQDRIRTLAQRANEATDLRREVAELRDQFQRQTTQQQPTYFQNPEVKDAVSKLDQFGVATKEYVAKAVEDTVNQRLSGLVYNMELDRLETKHSGADGLPAFDRAEYEAYINSYPQYRGYSPEDVYKRMYEDEIMDSRLKSMGKPSTVGQSPTLKPTRTRVQEETMTPDFIERRLKEPDGRQWYDRNIDKINAVIAKIPSTE